MLKIKSFSLNVLADVLTNKTNCSFKIEYIYNMTLLKNKRDKVQITIIASNI